jgi:hypothetical protein
MLRRTLLIFASALLLSAAGKPDFSGTWTVDLAKSDFGMMPPPEKLERTIKHADPDMKIKTVQVGQRGESITEAAYTTDGKEAKIQVRNREARVKAKWDGDKLNVETSTEFNGMAITQKESWSLSTDGKTLTIDNNITTPQGELTTKIIFSKSN